MGENPLLSNESLVIDDKVLDRCGRVGAAEPDQRAAHKVRPLLEARQWRVRRVGIGRAGRRLHAQARAPDRAGLARVAMPARPASGRCRQASADVMSYACSSPVSPAMSTTTLWSAHAVTARPATRAASRICPRICSRTTGRPTPNDTTLKTMSISLFPDRHGRLVYGRITQVRHTTLSKKCLSG
jgi:hypothetical protein